MKAALCLMSEGATMSGSGREQRKETELRH